MSHLFPSEAWLDAFIDVINTSEPYRRAAAQWEGDFYFVIQPSSGLAAEAIFYVDLWHGSARSGRVVTDDGGTQPEFVIRAPLATWRRVIEKKLDPIQGMMTGQLKLKGTLAKIMRAPQAAAELVNCATKVPTQFPE